MSYPARHKKRTPPLGPRQSPTSIPHLQDFIDRAARAVKASQSDVTRDAPRPLNIHAPAVPARRLEARLFEPYWNIPRRVLATRGIPTSAKLLYTVILAHERMKSQECYASNKTLAELAGISRSTFRRSLHRLEKAHAIKVIHRTHPTMHVSLTNMIKILPGWPRTTGDGKRRA